MEEKYFLSKKMTRYVLNADGVSKGGWCKNSFVNPSVAHAITVRGTGGVQRCGVENYVIPGLPNDIPVEAVIRLLEDESSN